MGILYPGQISFYVEMLAYVEGGNMENMEKKAFE